MSVVVAIGEPTSVRLPSTTAPALKSISRTTCLDKENINPVTGLACDNVRAGKKRKSKGDQIAFVEGSKSKKLKLDALQCKGLPRSRFALAAKFPVRSVGQLIWTLLKRLAHVCIKGLDEFARRFMITFHGPRYDLHANIRIFCFYLSLNNGGLVAGLV
ncbi:hypothetical protein FISHEDRAFT_61933 [Fistulina hepatica ATCC 64428]|uniref:Uncharacterized protein n=1 Tax=Fistulina hepatica ATCC 64428 TaxID=1128425 RepID=A0A0D7A106_9AGAR|nr:hypothetical protein FISHEDRAFT_61933 [Fistulina hepatica ATCC 64428]